MIELIKETGWILEDFIDDDTYQGAFIGVLKKESIKTSNLYDMVSRFTE